MGDLSVAAGKLEESFLVVGSRIARQGLIDTTAFGREVLLVIKVRLRQLPETMMCVRTIGGRWHWGHIG